jgi:hypothetical protein
MVAGRKTKFNDERAALIIDLVRKGNFISTAARAARVHPDTVDNWIKRGMVEGKGKYFLFFTALEEADADAEINAVGRWVTHQDKSPEAIKEYLRRRFPHWNVADKAEIKQEVTEDKDVINARIDEYFAERKKRGIILRDDIEESIHTDNSDTETGSPSKE